MIRKPVQKTASRSMARVPFSSSRVGFEVEAASSWLAASPDTFCTFSAKLGFPSLFKVLFFNMLAFVLLFEPLPFPFAMILFHCPFCQGIFQISSFFSKNCPSVSLLARLFSLYSSPLRPWLATATP